MCRVRVESRGVLKLLLMESPEQVPSEKLRKHWEATFTINSLRPAKHAQNTYEFKCFMSAHNSRGGGERWREGGMEEGWEVQIANYFFPTL